MIAEDIQCSKLSNKVADIQIQLLRTVHTGKSWMLLKNHVLNFNNKRTEFQCPPPMNKFNLNSKTSFLIHFLNFCFKTFPKYPTICCTENINLREKYNLL